MILVVQDDESTRETTARILRLAGHTVITAADGREALAILEHERHAVVFFATWSCRMSTDGHSVASNAGRRAARLGGHGNRVGRRARGLEGALADNSRQRLTSFDQADERAFDNRVAGPAALLVAKLHKIAERNQEAAGRRVKDKDALDVLRILRAIPTEMLVNGLRSQSADPLG